MSTINDFGKPIKGLIGLGADRNRHCKLYISCTLENGFYDGCKMTWKPLAVGKKNYFVFTVQQAQRNGKQQKGVITLTSKAGTKKEFMAAFLGGKALSFRKMRPNAWLIQEGQIQVEVPKCMRPARGLPVVPEMYDMETSKPIKKVTKKTRDSVTRKAAELTPIQVASAFMKLDENDQIAVLEHIRELRK